MATLTTNNLSDIFKKVYGKHLEILLEPKRIKTKVSNRFYGEKPKKKTKK
jgi:hypothetical protein